MKIKIVLDMNSLATGHRGGGGGGMLVTGIESRSSVFLGKCVNCEAFIESTQSQLKGSLK